MTDNSEQTSPQPAAADSEAAGPATVTGDSRGNRLVIIILALLVLAATAASSYSLYLSRQLQVQQQTMAANQTRVGEAVAEVAAGQQQLREAVERLDEAQQSTSAALQKFADRERMDNIDWAMAEIEHLIIIATQRLNLGHDADTALAALEAAARRLKDINNPSLIPLRKQLTSDINALRAVPETDVPGIALYLNDLISRAETLPLAADAAAPASPDSGQSDTEEVSGWRGLVQAVWSELRQLVVIQRDDTPPAERLAPDERYYLYQNLRVELASAREAALRRDTRNLHASIELVRDWLERYFDTDAAAVNNILESLEQMATVELAPDLPDISGSLESVRAWQRQQAESDREGDT